MEPATEEPSMVPQKDISRKESGDDYYTEYLYIQSPRLQMLAKILTALPMGPTTTDQPACEVVARMSAKANIIRQGYAAINTTDHHEAMPESYLRQ